MNFVIPFKCLKVVTQLNVLNIEREVYPRIWHRGKPQKDTGIWCQCCRRCSKENKLCMFTKKLPYFSQRNRKVKMESFYELVKSLKAFQIALASMNPEGNKGSYHICLSQCQVIKQEFKIFPKMY